MFNLNNSVLNKLLLSPCISGKCSCEVSVGETKRKGVKETAATDNSQLVAKRVEGIRDF